MNDQAEYERLRREVEALKAELQLGKGSCYPMINEMPVGFTLLEIIFDDTLQVTDCCCVLVNSVMMKMTGLHAVDVIGSKFKDLGPRFDSIASIYKHIATQGKPAVFEYYSSTLNKHFEINAYFPSPNLLASIVTDVTKQKEAEKELSVTKEKAGLSDRLKSAFLSNISHEIRTPMNGIIGFAELLNEDDLSESDRSSYTNIINSECKKLLNIVNDIVDISKIDAGLIELDLSPVQLNDLFLDVCSEYRVAARKKRIDLDVGELMPDAMVNVSADKNKLVQVLRNLLSNAVKFTNNGSITAVYSIVKNQIMFAVHDTGVGIDQKEQELIFEHFRQLNFKTNRHHGGNGLGLAISRGYVEKMGGRIWLESSLGKGSSFYFTIPYLPVSAERCTASFPVSAFAKSEGTMLVVDDVDFAQIYNKEIISRMGYQLLHARTGLHACDICRSVSEISLVLLDNHIPGTDVYSTLRMLKQIRPDLPVVIQSDNVSLRERELAFNAGCAEYISKPSSKNVLAGVVQRYRYRYV